MARTQLRGSRKFALIDLYGGTCLRGASVIHKSSDVTTGFGQSSRDSCAFALMAKKSAAFCVKLLAALVPAAGACVCLPSAFCLLQDASLENP